MKAALKKTPPTKKAKETPQETAGALNEQKINEQHEQGILAKLKDAADFPIPQLKPEWKITIYDPHATKSSKGLMANFRKKKKVISPDRVSKLDALSHSSPGKALMEINALMETCEDSPDLFILNAVSKQRALSMSGGSPQETLYGMKSAAIFAGKALATNGMTIGNADKFMQIYHTYLDRLKRAQQNVARVLKAGDGDPKYDSAKKEFHKDKLTLDYLFDEYKRASAYIDFLRKTFYKSSQRKLVFDHLSVTDAVVSITKGEGSKKILYGTAAEVLEHTYILLTALSHIPMLNDVVTHFQNIFEQKHVSCQLRWASIETSKLHHPFKLASIQQNKEAVVATAKKIFELNYTMSKKMVNVPLKKDFEFDPLFALGRITLYSYQAFSPDMQRKMFDFSIQALESAIKYDASKKKNKAQIAIDMTTRLVESMQLDREESK